VISRSLALSAIRSCSKLGLNGLSGPGPERESRARAQASKNLSLWGQIKLDNLLFENSYLVVRGGDNQL
jgi:hypothetical protein